MALVDARQGPPPGANAQARTRSGAALPGPLTRRGLDAILTDHPGVIWQASILVARFGESPEEAMQRRYDAIGCESYHGLVVCLDCLDDGCAYVDEDDEPICTCLHTAAAA